MWNEISDSKLLLNAIIELSSKAESESEEESD